MVALVFVTQPRALVLGRRGVVLRQREGLEAARPRQAFTGEPCPRTRFSLAEILVLVGGAIPPAPAVPSNTRISARMKRVVGHKSPVSMAPALPSRTRSPWNAAHPPGAHSNKLALVLDLPVRRLPILSLVSWQLTNAQALYVYFSYKSSLKP